MKLVVLSIVFAACVAVSYANGRGMYMGMYPFVDGRLCANDCSYLPPGNHPSCKGCDMYVTCLFGELMERYCTHGLEWDNYNGICNWPKDSTCHTNV